MSGVGIEEEGWVVMEHVIVNGELVRLELAQLPVLDRSIVWGEALVADVLLRNSLPFRLEQQVEVLAASLRLPEIGISYALSSRRIARDIATLASRSRIYNGIVRIILTPGCVPVEEECGILLPQGVNEIILLMEPLYSSKVCNNGIRLGYACFCRMRGDPLAVHKFASGMREHVALRRAIAEGYDDAVICDEDGALLATTRANIFAVVGGEVITPHPVRDGTVPGVMRGAVLETLAREGVMLYQERLTSEVVAEAKELFICSSAAGGVIRVAALGKRDFTDSAFTSRVSAALEQRLNAEFPSV